MKEQFAYPVDRFKGFSDAVFAIAITLLVLKFALPGDLPAKPTLAEQLNALLAIWPQYLTFFIGFFTIGVVWLNHTALFRDAQNITHHIMISNLALLFFVVLMPFPAAILERFGHTRVSAVFYGIILTLVVASFWNLRYRFLQAHPSERHRLPPLAYLTLPLYPVFTVVSYFAPIIGILGFLALTIVALLPRDTSAFAQERSPNSA
ncbi:MAG: DUF1211 domain-containing protein [Candidatus Eremiobacteraeota bacterium]|nr:DUF1211 domain-containing protein [Candidatus Eremiobacteraeota bacterium]